MVTVSTTQIYAFNGSLLDLLGLQVAPSFTRLNGEIVDSNGVLNESDDTTISINGGPTQSLNFDSAGTVTGLVGLTGTRPIAVFTVPSNPGVTYLYAPDGLPNLLGLPVLYSYDLDQTSFALPTTTPGIVDGTDGDDIMPVGYTDADGDRITNNVFLGGNGNDVIDGKGGNDSITAGSGSDSVLGGEGNDTLDGQAGNDTLRGGNGDDLIRGGASADSLVGGAGSDTVDYSDSTANVSVNLATNTVSGGTAQGDTISGFENIIGGSGNDALILSNISGSVIGGDGNDSILGGTGNDTLDGGAGNDTIRGGAGNDVFLNGGGAGADTVFGGDGDDIWRAGGTDSGSDVVSLEGGNDYAEIGFFTQGAPDILDGGAGQDTVAFDAPIITGNSGIILNDDGTSTTINFGTTVRNFEHVRGNAANNSITGNNFDNELVGLSGNDTLSGGGGNDTLDGGADNDSLTGGTGNDRLTGGTGADRFNYGLNGGLDTITDFNQNDEALGDGITTNNDFVDLTAYYDSISELRADYADDGILNQSNSGVNYNDNVAFGTNAGIAFTGINADNAKQLLTAETTGVPCFASGTLIKTSTGQVAIEKLVAGDLVATMDRGFQPLRWIGSRQLDVIDFRQHPYLLPIRIRAGALGEGLPLADLTVSPQHRILVRSKIAKRMFGAHEVLIPAKKLLAIEGIEIDENATSVEYFHMLFDQHEIVFSNGSATESLFTGLEAIRSLTEESRREVFTLFPALENPAVVSKTARLVPERGKIMKKLAHRHKQNGAPIFK
jgi:Ca2+-binding RTX toxin-like protein